MKLFTYNGPAINIKDIINPIYTGYRSKFFKHNNPNTFIIDFPKHSRAPTYKLYETINEDHLIKIFIPKEIYTFAGATEYHQIISCEQYSNIISYIPDDFLFAVAFSILNLKKKGNIYIAYTHIPIFYDIIAILRLFFNDVKISKSFIICEHYIRKKEYISRFLNFFRYYLDADEIVYPLKETPGEKILIQQMDLLFK